MASAGAVVDGISALPDDLLHSILTLVREATAVTRTAALSRRWRRVWIHAQQLDLLDSKLKRGAVPGHFVGFVDWVLAQRGEAGMASLNINMSGYKTRASPSPESVNEWLRYAMQHVANSFRLHLPWPYERSPSGEVVEDDEPVVVLPDSGRIISIKLYLPCRNRLQLPVAAGAKYEALTELRLWRATFYGAVRTLGDFVSSCCPCLRKLEIFSPKGLPLLVLRFKTLQELSLYSAEDLRILDVTAPNLVVFKLENCFGDDGGDGDELVRIAAPRLQEIAIDHWLHSRRPVLDIHDLTSVRRLSHLQLNMHGQYYAPAMDVGFWLLEHCPSADQVDVWLRHSRVTEGGKIVDLMTSEGSATFANVRTMDMTVMVDRFPEDHLVASISAVPPSEMLAHLDS
nr:unnamed protein product [Digitaria exilis]